MSMDGPDPTPPAERAGQATGQARWFIGLRPAPAVRARLHRTALGLAAAHGGRPIAAARMHLTVAFLGAAPRALEPSLLALLRTLPPPGTLLLDRLGSFGPRLLWIGPQRTPPWLEDLSTRLRAGLDALGANHDRKPLRPHVTLLRAAQAPVAPGKLLRPIDFGASELMLVDSDPSQPGGHYRWIRPWQSHTQTRP